MQLRIVPRGLWGNDDFGAGDAWASSRTAVDQVPSGPGDLRPPGPQSRIAHPVSSIWTSASASTHLCGQFAPLPDHVCRRCAVAAHHKCLLVCYPAFCWVATRVHGICAGEASMCYMQSAAAYCGVGGAAQAAPASRPFWAQDALASKKSVPFSAALSSRSAPSAKAIAAANYWRRQKEEAHGARTSLPPSMPASYLSGTPPAVAPAPVPAPMALAGLSTPQVRVQPAKARTLFLLPLILSAEKN